MNFIRFLLPLFFLPLFLTAQSSRQMNAAEIKLGIQKLGVTGSVLYIAAHPDDENTRLLTWLSKGKKVRAAYLSLTRGDGGQNLIGTEQAEELGLIRTQELLAARRIDGAEQYFSRAIDFGFSKTAEETFQIWNKDRLLGDVILTIREFWPDININQFPPDVRAGHGNHSASAILAIEGFAAAADPTRFPNLGNPWQAKRILWNTYNFGGNNTTSPDQLKIDVGGYNALLGKSYGELAAESRSEHKSQGFGSPSQRGPEFEYFALLGGDPAQTDLFNDVDISWNNVAGGDKIAALIRKINLDFNVVNPAASVSDLLLLRSLLKNVDHEALRRYKLKQVEELILSCAGIWFEINSLQPQYAVGDSIRTRVTAISLMADSLELPVSICEQLSGMPFTTLSGKLLTREGKIAPQPVTQPYWLTYNRSLGSYNTGPDAMDMPESKPIAGVFSVKIGNEVLNVERPIYYKYTDPVKGEIYSPLIITPPVVVSPSQKMIFSDDATPQVIRVKITAKKDKIAGNVSLESSDPVIAVGEAVPFRLEKKGDVVYVDLQFHPVKNGKRNALSEIRILAEVEGKRYSSDEKTISYDHLPSISYFPVAEFKYLNSDIKTAGKRIAYITGAGDRIPESLRIIGYSVDVFSPAGILNQNLNAYDAVIAGVRLYNVDADAGKITPGILEYVKNGGTYLVQYNVSHSLKTGSIGPYPFKLGNKRVTDETAPVTFLDATHRLVTYPNKITLSDFNNWVQERGLYFVSEFDSHYEALFSMHDPGEPANNGSLIVSDYGKGQFIYTSLSFFRQLPAGVPGAYRLFVNLIAKRQR